MAVFVFVPGAWHASWCWERLLPLLAAQGHRAVTPDLLGTGTDPTPVRDVTLAGWADQIAALVAAEAEPVILVGHSRGGIVISEVAERVPAKIQSLVYLTALLLPDGDTLQAAMARSLQSESSDFIVPGPDNTMTMRAEAIGPGLFHLTEPEWLERARSKLGAEPMAAYSTTLHLTEQNYGSVRRAYIECTQDRALPIALQREMQTRLPCKPVYTLESDHSPFYSQPEKLMACLSDLVSVL